MPSPLIVAPKLHQVSKSKKFEATIITITVQTFQAVAIGLQPCLHFSFFFLVSLCLERFSAFYLDFFLVLGRGSIVVDSFVRVALLFVFCGDILFFELSN